MGMFDSVIVSCECGERIWFQTKSGPCMCDDYELETAPDDVMVDVNRHAPIHCDCGNWLSVDIENRKAVVVPPPPPSGSLMIRVCDGKVVDLKRAMSEGGGEFVNYWGCKQCGQFDLGYLR